FSSLFLLWIWSFYGSGRFGYQRALPWRNLHLGRAAFAGNGYGYCGIIPWIKSDGDGRVS
ncbi:MAG: hypothetical protein AAF199_06360, partial [Pseudomonadota bacterium]